MSHKVCVSTGAAKAIKKLTSDIRDRVIARLTKLCDDPVPKDAIDISIDHTEVDMLLVAGYRVGWGFVEEHGEEECIVVLFVDEVI